MSATVRGAGAVSTVRQGLWKRWLWLLLVLLAFARLVFRLGAKNLWLDESFSLQRAESPWLVLLRGTIWLRTGMSTVPTTDQHPFTYFALLGAMVRLAGTSEFALRFVSVMAATLIVPISWSLTRHLARRDLLPPATPAWAVLLATANPFFLWFGQEARMYTLMALLALFSTYALLRSADAEGRQERRRWLVAYAVLLVALLSTHYFAVFILPVHALAICLRFWRNHRRLVIGGLVILLGLGGLSAGIAGLQVLHDPNTLVSFTRASLRTLLPDLINAFNLGLSVDLGHVWPLDLLFAALAVLGACWGLRGGWPPRGDWQLAALVLIPTLLLLAVNMVHPAYMDARHLSLSSGPCVLLVAAGLGWLWQRWRWVAGIAAAVLLAGTLYSTVNYYTLPQYDKGQVSSMGGYLKARVEPGDLVLVKPPGWWRLFSYYLPLDDLARAETAGYGTAVRDIAPNTLRAWPDELRTLLATHRRIWLADAEKKDEVDTYLQAQTWEAGSLGFPSPISLLNLELFLPHSPITSSLPAGVQNPSHATFGSAIALRGYDVGRRLPSGSSIPVTLYWQAMGHTAAHDKYILRLVAPMAGGQPRVLASTEREPFDGILPTGQWPQGAVIVEYSDVEFEGAIPLGTQLTLQMYDAGTLAKLPARSSEGAAAAGDGETLLLALPRGE